MTINEKLTQIKTTIEEIKKITDNLSNDNALELKIEEMTKEISKLKQGIGESIDELDNRIKNQKGVEVIFSKIKSSNHFFKNKEKELKAEIEKYLKEKTALI